MAIYTAAEGAELSFGTGSTAHTIAGLISFTLDGEETEAVPVEHCGIGPKIYRPSKQTELGDSAVVVNFDEDEHEELLAEIAAATTNTWTFTKGEGATPIVALGFVTTRGYDGIEGVSNVKFNFNIKLTGE